MSFWAIFTAPVSTPTACRRVPLLGQSGHLFPGFSREGVYKLKKPVSPRVVPRDCPDCPKARHNIPKPIGVSRTRTHHSHQPSYCGKRGRGDQSITRSTTIRTTTARKRAERDDNRNLERCLGLRDRERDSKHHQVPGGLGSRPASGGHPLHSKGSPGN